MKVRVGPVEREGQAVDLREAAVDPGTLAAAIADPGDRRVQAPPPGPLHERVGTIRPGMSLSLRCALTAAGRSRGMRAPQAPAIERLNREIAAIEPEHPDLRGARRRAAETGEELAGLEAQVERLSGRLAERRDAGAATADLEARLADLTRELTEAETEAIAAREALERAEERAEAARDAQERRLSLVDRRENRRREARSWFVDRLAGRFHRALAALPVDAEPVAPAAFDGDPIAAALAAARIGAPAAPIVLVDSPFETAVAARAALGAPVILASL